MPTQNKTILLVFLTIAVCGSVLLAFRFGHSIRSDAGNQSMGGARSSQTPTVVGKTSSVAAKARPSAPVIAPNGLVDVPLRFRFADVAKVQTGKSFKEWTEKFPPDQRKQMQDFAKKFTGVYDVKSEQQVAWMAEKGYLMPEDIIAAANMSDAQLRDMAAQGNLKAGLLYSQRAQDKYNQALAAFVASGGQVSKFPDTPDGKPLFQDLLGSNHVLSSNSDNPFVGYQLAWQASSLPDKDAAATGVIRGLMLADINGDLRVSTSLLDEYRQAGLLTDQQISATSAAESAFLRYLGTLGDDCRMRYIMPGTL